MVDGLLARPLHGDRYEWARTIVETVLNDGRDDA